MAMNISSHKIVYVRPLRISHILNAIDLPAPHPRTVIVTALLLCGPIVTTLVVLGILPLTFLLGFIGFATTAIGGTLALIFCGEL